MTTTLIRRLSAGAAAIVLAAIGVGAVGAPASAGNAKHDAWQPVQPGPEPQSNPLKGFVPFSGDYSGFPHSMEWAYFPLDAVMTGPDTFDWSVLEAALDLHASREHQTALRFFVDYPQRESGIPQYLIDGGLVTHPYTEFGNSTSVIPDYNDPELVAAFESFAAALGAKYDGDPRLAYLQVGLVGFWGEWHTWPYNGDGFPDYMPNEANRLRVLDAFLTAFDVTELEVRNPTDQNAALDIGYHDDSFALTTLPSEYGWYFGDELVRTGTTGKWATNSVGGEIRPELQYCLFSVDGCPVIQEGGDNDFPGSVEFTHATWLLNHYAFATGYSAEDRERAIEGAKSLGYSFQVTQSQLPKDHRAGSSETYGIQLENVGIAPFYYDWPISIAWVDKRGDIATETTTQWTLADIASGESVTLTQSLAADGLAPGKYTVVIQGTNPMPGGQPVRFANAAQDADVDGWLTIGTVKIKR